jgi:FkbM family methyltransferase
MGTSPGDRQASRRVVQYLMRLPLVDRIKAVKDRVLSQLDSAQSQLAGLKTTTDALLANDSVLLEAVINFTQVLEQTRDSTSDALRQLGDSVAQVGDSVAQDNQESRRLLAGEVHELKRLLNEFAAPGQSRVVKPIRPESTPRGDEARTPGMSCFPEPEAALMVYLYSYLPNRCALDIGANTGDVSEMLLDAGFEVHAFEPYLQVCDRLRDRLGARKSFHAHPLALGDADGTGTLHVASDTSGTDVYGDSTRYSSLVQHAMPPDLAFTDNVEVAVRRLETLHSEASIPAQVGLVKIDTEGFDLKVVRGMGSHRYPVVVSEFWDSRIPFGGSEGVHTLADLVEAMRSRDYHWHIVFYRIWGREETRFYCNFPRSLEGAWGNVFFFQEYDVFSRARDWASSVFPPTYLTR